MMTKIHGQFDVTLPVPIAVDPKIINPTPSPCIFHVEGCDIQILPLTYKDATYDEEFDDYIPPYLKEIRVWITRDALVEKCSQGNQKLAKDEEDNFEKILIEATRRFVIAIKRRIGQWDVDTRHPVGPYSYKYFRADVSLQTEWPLASGSRSMPEYTLGSITFDTYGDVTTEIWEQVSEDVKSPITQPFYEELLYDAISFQRSMRYDIAVLYSGVAVELILEQGCKTLLTARGGLTDEQCEAVISDRRIPSLVHLINKLEPSIQISGKEVQNATNLRNKIAHGETLTVTGQEASRAIQIARGLKKKLTESSVI